jgi:hypothetical protein
VKAGFLVAWFFVLRKANPKINTNHQLDMGIVAVRLAKHFCI